jgi:hypothetical protein
MGALTVVSLLPISAQAFAIWPAIRMYHFPGELQVEFVGTATENVTWETEEDIFGVYYNEGYAFDTGDYYSDTYVSCPWMDQGVDASFYVSASGDTGSATQWVYKHGTCNENGDNTDDG